MNRAVLDKAHNGALILGNAPAVHFGFKCFVKHDHHAVNLGNYSLDKSAVPLLKGFLHDGMVGVAEHLLGCLKRLVKGPALVTHYHADKLRQGDNGMGVVHLNAVVVCEILHSAKNRLMLSDKISNCGCAEEILLLQAEYLACLGFVVGIEHPGDVLGSALLLAGFGELAPVEQAEVELVVGFSLPQTQSTHVLSAVADNRIVVGNRIHIAVSVVNYNSFLLAANAPGVAVSLPVVCSFGLESVLDALLEQTVLITYSVAVQRKVQCRRAVQEARCKSAQTAVAESGVLNLLKFGNIHAKRFQFLSSAVQDTKAQQVVVYRASHQELH